VNISPLVAAGPSPISVSALAAAAPAVLIGTPLSSDLAITGSYASIVDISSLGQLMSTVSAFQAAQSATAGAASSGFGSVAATAELLVGAVNDFSASNNSSVQDLLGTAAGNPFLTVFNVPSSSDTGVTLLAALSQIGITDQSNTIVTGGTDQFNVNLTTLQAAFGTDPAGTASVLAQAFTVLGRFAATVVAQNASLFPSDTASTLDTTVPASPFSLAVVDAALASLSPADAARVNTALQSLLNDQALGAATVDSLPVASTAQVAPAQSNGNPTVSSDTAATSNSPALPAANVASANQAQANQSGAPANSVPASAAASANTPPAGANSSVVAAATGTTAIASNQNKIAGTAVPVSTTAASSATGTLETAVAVPQTAATQVSQAQSTASAATAAFIENNAPPVLSATTITPASQSGTGGGVSGTASVAAATQVNALAVAPLTTAAATAVPTTVPASNSANSQAITGLDTIGAGAEAAAATPVLASPDPSLDPSLAAAIAAYRVGDSLVGSRVIDTEEPAGELVADVVEVVPVNPVAFNSGEGGAPDHRARNAKGSSHAVASGGVAEVDDSAAPAPTGVDISA